jgi:hypothetical protein
MFWNIQKIADSIRLKNTKSQQNLKGQCQNEDEKDREVQRLYLNQKTRSCYRF